MLARELGVAHASVRGGVCACAGGKGVLAYVHMYTHHLCIVYDNLTSMPTLHPVCVTTVYCMDTCNDSHSVQKVHFKLH